MFSMTRTLQALLALSAIALGGCTSLLGDFTYDPNGGQAGSGSGGNGMQGDIVITPPSGLITTEQGAKATFTIALRVPPADNVVIALSSSNMLEGIVSPPSVTFTPDNYAAPQTVQITGVDDATEDKTQTYYIRTSQASSTDGHYNGTDPIDPEVKNVDDESAGFLVTPTSGLVTTESGGEATFTVVLTRAPTADVVIPLSSDRQEEGVVSPAVLTFTALNWMAPQIVTVTGVNDDGADKAQEYHAVTGAAVSADGAYDKLDPDDVSVTNQDNDTAGVMLTPGTGLLTFENGAMTSFGIALSSPPKKDVTIALSSSDAAEGTVMPERVVFTPLNWMAPQVVTVTGVDDNRSDGNRPYLILTAPAETESEDDGYRGLDGADAEVTNIDDDSASLVVTPTLGLTTSEKGDSATFTVALASKPRADVVLDVTSKRPEEGVVSPALLTFTEVNWNAPQEVTVTGVNDKVADGMQTYTVSVNPKDDGADPNYAILLDTDVSVWNTDDDSAGITVMAASGLQTSEDGKSVTFTVALNSQPTMDVSIDLTSSDPTEGTVNPAKLVFTKDNYAAPQVVTVKGVNDDMQDGSQPYRIITAPAVSNDPGYANMDASNVDLQNIDDDSAGIRVNPTNQTLVTSESGGTATFTVVLNSQPASGTEVNIPVSSNNTKEGTVSTGNLRFTTDNWRAPQTVTVKGVDDDSTADGAQPYRIVLGKAQSNDGNYSVFDPPDLNASNTDNDSAGITIRNPGNLMTRETGVTTTTFQIVLNSRPTADVVIGLSSSNTKEGTVSPASLTFTSANWNAAQTVTATGVNDAVADGSQVYRIITAKATGNDTKYSAIDPADVSITNVDDDSPGVSVTAPAGGLVTRETGATATFSIQLNSQPTADVTIPVRSSNVKEGTVSPASLVFTSMNWNSPHVVTVTGIDDNVADGPQPYSVIIDQSASNDPLYKNLDAADVAASNIDNDSAGITVSAITGDTNETGTTASFTIALNSEPKNNVTITLSSSNIKEGTVSPGSVTFTNLNYNAPQKITVTGVNDQVADGPQPYTIDLAKAVSDDAGYKGMDPPDVSLNNVDDDSAGITVMVVKNKSSEAGGTASFTIRLNSQPTAPVTIPLSSGNTGEGTLSVTQVTFGIADYASAQTVTVTGVDDPAADGDQPYSVVLGAATSTDKGYNGMNPADVSLTNVDNDSAGVEVSATEGTTGEKPSYKPFTFTVKLTSKPSADVVIPLTSTDPGEGSVSPATLTFTSSNWNGAQTVTVTGEDDAMADGAQPYKVQLGAATSTDKGYSGYDFPTDIELSNLDDDSAGIEVTPAKGSTSEKGITTTFTIVLLSQPSGNVTIPLATSKKAEGTLTAESVTFTKDNWNSPVTVTVHGEDDRVADGPQTYTIRTGIAMSSDPGYNGMDADDVDVVNLDDDVAGIDVSAASGPTSEGGGTATFTVVLNSKPTADVSIPVSSSNMNEGTLGVTSIDFTTDNWDVLQTVTVTGVNDDVADNTQGYSIVLGKPTSADDGYAAIDPNDVAFNNTDNDSAGFEVSEALSTISESGTSTTFEIVLSSQPKASVVIPLTVSDSTEAKLAVASVTFTTSNWKIPKPVTVTGVDDKQADRLQNTKVLTGIVESDDPGYDGKNPPDVSITTLDNDSAFISVMAPMSTTTGESPLVPAITFSVVLTSEPTASVTLPIISSSTDEGVVTVPASGSLVFDASDWDQEHLVTITGVQDEGAVDGNRSYLIQFGPSVSDDSDYNAKTPDEIMFTNTDDDL